MRGYKEEGTTTTPFDMCVLNDLDRFHLVGDVIDRVPQLGARAAYAKQAIRDKLIEHKQYIARHGDDMPEIAGWTVGAGRRRPAASARPRPTTCRFSAACRRARPCRERPPHIAAEHRLQAGHQARGAFPDLGLVGIEPQQDDVGVVAAALVPGGDAAAPQPVDHRRIVLDQQRAVDRGEQVVVLGGEGRDGAMAVGQLPEPWRCPSR